MNVQDVQAKETAKYPEIWLGNPYPLGATWTEEAVNFAVFSETASAVDLCLFHSIEGAAEQVRIHMTEQTDQSGTLRSRACSRASSMVIASLDPTSRSVERVSTAPSC